MSKAFTVKLKFGADIGVQDVKIIIANSYYDKDGVTTFEGDNGTVYQCETAYMELDSVK